MSFTPKQLAEEIKKEMPDFSTDYKTDFRQAIADSWPASSDDSVAKKDWGLSYDIDISEMTKAVSYTHLDVYKRQIRLLPEFFSIRNNHPIPLVIQRLEPVLNKVSVQNTSPVDLHR